MGVIETITLQAIRLAQIVPTLFVHKDRVAEAVGSIHQCGMSTDVRAGNNHQHGELLGY